MQFGVQFFPSVLPEKVSPASYFSDCLKVVEESEALGFTHARIVEHYFTSYGGYSPNPLLFLAAASQRTKATRLITGAILPVFNNPLKLAGEIGMLDAISNGRIDVGLARAFLPQEFRRFGISMDESVERFREGLFQLDLLLREEAVSHAGKFHQIIDTTSYPRPTQRPRPKFYIACTTTADSFEFAGKNGYSVMTIPVGIERMRNLMAVYRDAYVAAGHPGRGEVMVAFHSFVDRDAGRARQIAKPYIETYLKCFVEAASEWLTGTTSTDYVGYDKMVEKLKADTMESYIASGSALIGTPEEVRTTLARLQDEYGGFEHASIQVNFGGLPLSEALPSMNLFAAEVMPAFASDSESRAVAAP